MIERERHRVRKIDREIKIDAVYQEMERQRQKMKKS